MKQTIVSLYLVLAASFPIPSFSQPPAPTKTVPDANRKLSPADVAALEKCALVFHVKAGMTVAEADEEIDAAYRRWLECIGRRGIKLKSSSSGRP